MADWYYSSDGTNKRGPVLSKTLRLLAQQGVVTPSTLIWKEGLPRWVKASKVNGLFPAGVTGPPSLTPHSTNSAKVEVRALEDSDSTPPVSTPLTKRRKWLVDIAAWGIIGAVVWNIQPISLFILDRYESWNSRDRRDALANATAEAARLLADSRALSQSHPPQSEGIETPPRDSGRGREPAFTSDAPQFGFRFKGLSLGMTPSEVTAAALDIADDAALPSGAVRGFWPPDQSIAPTTSIPANATAGWYYGYSIPPSAQPNARTSSDSAGWKRVGWVYVVFDASHQTIEVGVKIRQHFGTVGPTAIASNDLTPAELARRIVDSYQLPELTPTTLGNGWEYENRDEGWKVEFSVVHWTAQSFQSGVAADFIRMDDIQVDEFRRRVALETKAALESRGLVGALEVVSSVGDLAKIDTAWVLRMARTSRNSEINFD